MTNTTEMPEKIWAENARTNGLSVFGDWSDIIDMEEESPKGASYTRTDTIPSKAEVAREFADEVLSKRWSSTDNRTIVDEIRDVLKEWEDAESK